MRAVLLGCVVLVSATSFGQTLLKLQGSSFAPIRQKALEAKMEFEGDFAKTKLNLTFYNPSFNQREGDFLYTVPEGAVVTSFAYWFNGERVDAQIVERERAEVIYEAIRQFRRDPALVEMVGKNLFRARIFPIEGRADLRIEMTMVSVAKNGAFVIPMTMEKGKPLESASVTVNGRSGLGVEEVTNNFGLPSTLSNGRYNFHVEQTNWRPDKDLRIGLKRNAFGASLYSARSGGGLGFFSLNITAEKPMQNAKVVVSGVRVSDVHNQSVKELKAGESFCVTGRYSGSGTATVTLSGSGGKRSQTVAFQASNVPNNMATKFWATDLIDACGKDPKRARTARETSLRYTLPSPYTSWLAIPKSERKNFAYAIKTANAVVLGRRQAEAVRKGKSYVAALKTLQAQLKTTDRQILGAGKAEVDQAYEERLHKKVDDLGSRWRDRIAKGQPFGVQEVRELRSLDAQYNLLERNIRVSVYRINEATSPIRADLKKRLMAGSMSDQDARRIVARLHGWEIGSRRGPDAYDIDELFREEDKAYEREVVANGEPSAESQRVRKRSEAVKVILGASAQFSAGWYAQNSVANLAQTAARAELDNDEASAQKAMEKLRAIEKWIPGVSVDATVRNYRSNFANSRAYEAGRTLLDIVRKRGDDSDEVRTLRQQIENWRKIGGSDKRTDFWESIPLYGIGEDIERLVLEGKSISEIRTAVDDQRTRLRNAGFKSAQSQISEGMEAKYQGALWTLGFEKERPNPDEQLLQREDTLLRALGALIGKPYEKDIREALTESRWWPAARWEYLKELRKPNPNPEMLQEYRNIMIDDTWRGKEYVDLQLERIATDVMIDKLEKEPRTPEIDLQIAELTKKAEALRARMGDPVAFAGLPQSALRVTATFPWGERKLATWDAAQKRWSVKFDVPAYATEGANSIVFRGELPDGSFVTETYDFTVDLTRPHLSATAKWWQGKLVVDVTGSADLARIKLVLLDRAPLELKAVSSEHWSVVVDLSDSVQELKLVAFDKAHNRSEITVDVPPRP